MKKGLTNFLLITLIFSTTALMAGSASSNKLVELATKEAGEIEPSVLKAMVDKGTVIILDVREIEQKADGNIYADDYFSITRGNLEFYVGNKIKDKDAVIVTYCRGGNRGVLAAQTLKRLGYKNATNLKGGLRGWVKAGYPIETELGTFKITKEE